MLVHEFFKCFVVHFALSHVLLLFFHFSLGLKVILPMIEKHLKPVSFQYAYLLPHDFVSTFMFIYFMDLITPQRQKVEDFIVPTVIFTVGSNALSEMRVVFYFYSFPSMVAFIMFVVRTVVHLMTNLLIVHMYIQ